MPPDPSSESEDPLQLNLDGEPIEPRRYRVEVAERVPRFHLPPDSSLLTPRKAAGQSMIGR